MGGRGEGGLGRGDGGGSGFSLTVQLVVAAAWSLVHSSALMAPQLFCMHRYCWLHPARACSPFRHYTHQALLHGQCSTKQHYRKSRHRLQVAQLACSLKYQRPDPDAGSNTHAVVALAEPVSTVVAWAQAAGPVA